MPTVRVTLGPAAYVNLSMGESNCFVFAEFLAGVRFHVGDIQPDVDTDLYVQGVRAPQGEYSGKKMKAYLKDISATGDQLWARSEDDDVELIVIRGTSTPSLEA